MRHPATLITTPIPASYIILLSMYLSQIQSAVKKLTVRAEAGLISCVYKLYYILIYVFITDPVCGEEVDGTGRGWSHQLCITARVRSAVSQ